MTGVQTCALPICHVGDAVKRSRRAQHRSDADLVSGVRRLARLAERHQFFAVGRELVNRVVLVVGEPQVVFTVDEDAVRPLEHALAPGIEEFSFLVEDDDRVLAAIEHVNAVVRIAGNARHFDEAGTFRRADPFDQRNSEKWREMGQSALARIAESAGVFQAGNDESYAQFNSDENVLRMAEALQGSTVRIKVGVEKGTDGHGDKNSVADWGSPNPDSNGHRTWLAFDAAPAAPKSAFAPKTAAPAKAAGTKPAWIK